HHRRVYTGGRAIWQKAQASVGTGDNRVAAHGQPLAKTFVISKEEHFVLLDWAAQRCAKLVALEGWRSSGCVEEVAGVEGAIAQILEEVSMQLVRSRRGHDADLSAGAFAILGAIAIRQDVVFPHGVDSKQHPAGAGRGNEQARGVGTDVIDSIDQKSIRFRPLARHGESRPGAVVECIRAVVSHAYVEGQKLIEAAPVQRQLLDLLLA